MLCGKVYDLNATNGTRNNLKTDIFEYSHRPKNITKTENGQKVSNYHKSNKKNMRNIIFSNCNVRDQPHDVQGKLFTLQISALENKG